MDKHQEFKSKSKYKISNWAEYNKGLKSRGNITVWLSEEAIKAWEFTGKRERGGKIDYSDLAIETCLTIKQVMRLKLRQTEGFVESLFVILKVLKSVPDYSTLCRRAGKLNIDLKVVKQESNIAIIVDSTGLKVYGEGEWKVRKFGWCKHRTWRKLHIGINGETQEIVAEELTENNIADADEIENLLDSVDQEIDTLIGDGGYDKKNVRKELIKRDIKGVIPPQKNAVKSKDPILKERNKDVQTIRRIGRKRWKEKVKYHKRSLVEVAMFRYKTIIGDKINARKLENEKIEVRINCSILNVMTRLGMPVSTKIN
jgi:IS5 family transposase